MSKMNWNRLGFFILGTFGGGFVLSLVSGIGKKL